MSHCVKAGSKELRQLARRLRPGLRLVADGKSKVVITDGAGRPLRYPDGRPVGMPNSPCPRTVKDVERRLVALGALRA